MNQAAAATIDRREIIVVVVLRSNDLQEDCLFS